MPIEGKRILSMKKKEIESIPNIELRSGGVQSIIAHNPPFILRYGIGILLLLLIVLIGLSKFISYPNIMHVSAEVLRNVSVEECVTAKDCMVIWMKKGVEEKVEKGDTIAILSQILSNGNDTVAILSKKTGVIYKPKEYSSGQIIPKGVTYMIFCDGVLFDKKKQVRSSFEKNIISKLHVGMLVEIDNQEKELLRIKSISKIPDSKGLYNVYYESMKDSKTIQLFDEKVNVNIKVENESIFDKIFSDRLHVFRINKL